MNLFSIPSFTNVGFSLHARRFQPIEADLSGKTILITGATGGLGKAAARALAGLGAKIAIVGRSESKLEDAVTSIEGDVVPYRADLSLMAEIRRLAAVLHDKEPQIDVLINNVGVLLPERQLTEEGIERTVAVDLAGHFLLTNLLAERLVESAPARVINVTSGGMYSERIRPRDLQFERGEYKGSAAYARSKRGQVILTKMWADRFAETGVVVHAMHPGWAKTAGVADSLPTFNKLMSPFLRTPDQGADTIVWLAAADEPSQSSGLLWFDRAPVDEHLFDRTRESEADREQLWTGLSDLTESDFPIRTVAR